MRGIRIHHVMDTFRNILRRSLDLEAIAVAGCVALGFFSQRALPLGIFAALFFSLIRLLAQGKFSARTPLDAPLIILLLMSGITLWVTALPDTTTPQVFRLLSGMGLFYAIVNWANSLERIRWLAAAFALVGITFSAYALLSVEWTMGKIPFLSDAIYKLFPRLVEDVIHRNVMAGSLVILLPVTSALLIFTANRKGWLLSALWAVSALAMATITLLTQSRGGLLALLSTLAILPVLRWKRGWILPACLGLVVITAFLWLGPEKPLEFIASSENISGINGRAEIWSRAVYMIQDFAFTGIGMGTFGPVADSMYPFFIAEQGSIPHAHHLLLQIAVDMGIPGLLAWLAAWMLVTVAAWQLYRKGQNSQNHWASGLGAGIFCCQVALLMHGQLDAVTWGMVRPAPLVWALWGSAIAGWLLFAAPRPAK